MVKGIKSIFGKREGKIALLVSLICCLYLLLGFYFLPEGKEFMLLIPPIAFLGLYLLFFKLEYFLLLAVFLTPLSQELYVTEANRLSLPVEMMAIAFVLVFCFQLLFVKNYSLKSWKHPVPYALAFYILVLLVTSFTSTMPEVSFKHTAMQLWFIIPFFFALLLLLKNVNKIGTFYWLYCSGLLVVVIISFFKFYATGFEFYGSYHIMQPFYKDHTIYGAVLALFIPLSFLFFIDKDVNPVKWKRYISGVALLILIVGLVYSYCRAAWICVVVAAGVGLILKTGIKLRWIFFFGLIFGSLFLYYQNDIISYLERNKQNSSGNILQQMQSISNISTDDSNLERMNRWACAIRMGKEKPLTGFGPGTYQFHYNSYQLSTQINDASTRQGDLGNAHSEYLGPFAESGIFGTIAVILIFGLTLLTGIRVSRTAESKVVRQLAFYLVLSLVTYYVHGILNNYLDTEKISIPFWGFTAAIVALDLNFPKKKLSSNKEKTEAQAVE